MDRHQIIQKLRELSGNRYLVPSNEQHEDGFHVSDYDLKRMDQRKLTKFMKSLDGNFSVTDKGIWFK